jgi:sigma-B regulation protein RsbU (phosphoserine phosphatase)
MPWERGNVQLAPGDMLVLYSDGIPEAQDQQGSFFGEERLLETVQASQGCSAREVCEALLAQVRQFVGDAPQYDDITLMVLAREL